MSEYVPTTEQVRGAYARAGFLPVSDGERNERRAAFDRWLAAHDREVKAEALREAAGAMPNRWRRDDDGPSACAFRIESQETP